MFIRSLGSVDLDNILSNFGVSTMSTSFIITFLSPKDSI